MKRLTYNLSLIALIWLLVLGKASARGNIEVSKSYDKVLTATPGLLLNIDNRYGEVKILTDARDRITVKITMKAWGRNERVAQEQLDRISIQELINSSEASFTTEISGNNVIISGQKGFEINYEVHIPKTTPLDLTNKFGDTFVSDLQANATMELKYGKKIAIGRLTGEENELEIAYCAKVELLEVANGDIELGYNGKSIIDKISESDLAAKYGNVKINEAIGVEIEMKYGNIDIRHISGSFEMEQKYGNSAIEHIDANLRTLEIDCKYGNVSLYLPTVSHVKAHISVSYGSFIHHGLKASSLQEDNEGFSSASYDVRLGNGDGMYISLSNKYGNITMSN